MSIKKLFKAMLKQIRNIVILASILVSINILSQINFEININNYYYSNLKI